MMTILRLLILCFLRIVIALYMDCFHGNHEASRTKKYLRDSHVLMHKSSEQAEDSHLLSSKRAGQNADGHPIQRLQEKGQARMFLRRSCDQPRSHYEVQGLQSNSQRSYIRSEVESY